MTDTLQFSEYAIYRPDCGVPFPYEHKVETLKELFNIFDTELLNVVGNIDSFRSIMRAVNERLDQFEADHEEFENE